MFKRTFAIALFTALAHQSAQAGTMGQLSQDCWSGFYAGVSGAYLQSGQNRFQTTVDQVNWNQLFFPNALVVAGTLSNAGTELFSIKQRGAGWGGQVGYQVVKDNAMLWGAEAEVLFAAGMATAENYTRLHEFGVTALNYQSVVEEIKDIDYLASLRGRAGYLVKPSLLLYITGGLTFAQATLTTNTTIENTNSPDVFPANTAQGKSSKSMGGFTAGLGAEWNFMNNLSAKLEYKYYDLGSIPTSSSFIYLVNIPTLASYASARVHSRAKFAYNSVELGLNYHFC